MHSVQGTDKELLRTWTISSIPQESQSTHTFSITVKKVVLAGQMTC